MGSQGQMLIFVPTQGPGSGVQIERGWKDFCLSSASTDHSPLPQPLLPRPCLVSAVASPSSFLSPPPPTSRLSSGKLQEFGVGDGSKLTLVPTVEAGLMVNG